MRTYELMNIDKEAELPFNVKLLFDGQVRLGARWAVNARHRMTYTVRWQVVAAQLRVLYAAPHC